MTTTITFEVPDRSRIAEVQAEVVRVLDEHTIVNNVAGSGQVLIVEVTFGNKAEVAPLTRAAYLAAMHLTPVEMRVA
jgi:hypothetical protein